MQNLQFTIVPEHATTTTTTKIYCGDLAPHYCPRSCVQAGHCPGNGPHGCDCQIRQVTQGFLTEGANLYDFFDDAGCYLGPDDDGVGVMLDGRILTVGEVVPSIAC